MPLFVLPHVLECQEKILLNTNRFSVCFCSIFLALLQHSCQHFTFQFIIKLFDVAIAACIKILSHKHFSLKSILKSQRKVLLGEPSWKVHLQFSSSNIRRLQFKGFESPARANEKCYQLMMFHSFELCNKFSFTSKEINIAMQMQELKVRKLIWVITTFFSLGEALADVWCFLLPFSFYAKTLLDNR